MGKIIGLVVLIAAIWHFKVSKTDGVKLTGLFKEEPELGYTWKNTTGFAPRYFWQNTDVNWAPGLIHPQYNVQASTQTGQWVPLPGYTFANKEPGNFQTEWQPGQLHPRLKAWASMQEGYWMPVPGYRFTGLDVNGKFTETEWEPGQRIDELKVFAALQAGTYSPYPGYRFVNPNESLAVAWTPGMRNPNNSSLVASQMEGQWETLYETYATTTEEPTFQDHVAGWIAKGVASGLLEEIFGKNTESERLKRESTGEFIRAGVSLFKD